ncbi:hypothetical protein WA026_015004 [Henosepilachna vigintioctopunctata]|uniref:Tubulin-specific chaperone E n=1 Tax=Henosepilachna vigintioctopunctata TaxID=420089 RepID=A0AAW1U6Y1_9CUCU
MITPGKKETDMVSDCSKSPTNIRIGDRVECLGHIGTVKYIGPVETHSSNWLGIDWDDQFRGKHNGTINGVQYFESRFPKSGSFVRPEKVELGHSVVKSIIDRYGQNENETAAQQVQQKLFHFQQSINAPFLEMVGFDKIRDQQSNFDSLKVVNLRLQNISSAGEPGQLKNLCPNIQELDLSKNLISYWITVFDICIQLDQLRWLNLSENQLNTPNNVQDYCFPNVETLICTSMNLTWEDILEISVAFPGIQELRVPLNSIQCLNTPPNVLQSLRILDIDENNIEKWSEICKLCILENLEELFIGNTGLRKIEFAGTAKKVNIFGKLKKLSISYNQIDNWESINELNRLKSLEDLRFVKNPILETQSEANRFQIVVARIGNLKTFNGTEIKAENRRGAEYDYIKLYGLEWLRVKDTSTQRDEFLGLHNRYMDLIDMYGEPEESELIIKPKSIKNTLVTLNIMYQDEKVVKKLPQTIVVHKLMVLVQKIFKLNQQPNLVYVSQDDPNFRIILEDHRDLDFYSMRNGDIIVVSL